MARFRRILEDYEARLASRGRTSLRLSNRQGHTIPQVRAGDRIEVAARGVVLLLGVFQPD